MGKKILLADDSITIQKVIELTFSDEDFDVVTVGNGRLAIERIQETQPDIVLCDIVMPEKDASSSFRISVGTTGRSRSSRCLGADRALTWTCSMWRDSSAPTRPWRSRLIPDFTRR